METTMDGSSLNMLAENATPPSSSLMDYFAPQAIPEVILYFALAFLLVNLLGKLTNAISERFSAQRLILKQLSTFINFFIYTIVTIISFFRLFHLSSQAILALSGTLAVVIGFGLKDVASSFLAGITILTTKPFQVGDRIDFGGYYGEVLSIGLRTVRLQTLDDNLVTIPTSKFLSDAVASSNAGALDCMVVMPFYLAASADHKRAGQIIRDALLASKYLYLGKPHIIGYATQMTQKEAIIVITAKAYVFDTRYEKALSSDVTDRVLQKFREEKIAVAGADISSLNN